MNLFTQTFIPYKTFTVKKQKKPGQNELVWFVVVLRRCFC